jgi:outer membrane protein OmpA-like peptidoglycan-associated protein
MQKSVKNIMLWLLLLTALSGQGQERHIKKGDDAYNSGNYMGALEYYKKALPDIKRKAGPIVVQELVHKIGDSYLQMNQFEKALPWFKKAAATGIFSEKLYLKYGRTLTLNNKTNEAVAIYRDIHRRTGNNIARKRIVALESYDDTTHSAVAIINQYDINSKFSDYSPAPYKNSIVFSSSRPLENKKTVNKRTSQNYSNLYKASYDNTTGKWSSAAPFRELLHHRKSEGVFTYSSATNQAFYMQCPENDHQCTILTSRPDPEGGWDKPEEVAFNIDGTAGHPAVSHDGKTLYFVSDMAGGYGGKDIWKVTRVDNSIWSIPVNLGASVNTAYDEVFPSLSGDTLLFFASDRPESYGGLDFYVSRIKGEDYAKPSHPGFPFNTVRDDFGVCFTGTGGLFTSNRNNIVQSDDIFMFKGFPGVAYIRGDVRDKTTNTPVAGAEIALHFEDSESRLQVQKDGSYAAKFALQTIFSVAISAPGYLPIKEELKAETLLRLKNGDVLEKDFLLLPLQPVATIEGTVILRETKKPASGETVVLFEGATKKATAKSGASGAYRFENIPSGETYTLKISKEGFFSESRKVTIPELETSAVFSKATGYDTDFLLTRIEKEKEIVINNIFYDFNKATLRPESKKELNKLVSMLRETPRVIIQINAHTDSRGSESYNKRLSQRRAQGVVDYLTARGISSERLFARGYGESTPLVNKASTEAEHQLNRRTTFKVLAVMEERSSETPENTALTSSLDNTPNKQEAAGMQDGVAYRVQLLASSKELPDERFRKLLDNIHSVTIFTSEQGGIYKYELGSRSSYQQAVNLRRQIVNLGHQDCFITAYHRGKRIAMQEALKIENP